MAITTPPMGIVEGFGIALETTFGTAVAPDVWWRPVSNTLRRVDPANPLSGPTGGAFSRKSSGRVFRGKPDISGTVVLEAEYDDIGFLLANALATPTFTDDTPVIDAFTHTFTVTDAIPATTPTSITCARVTGTDDWQFSGCMINAIEISGAQDRLVTVSLDIIAQGGGFLDVPDSVSTLSAAPFIEFHDSYVRADHSATGTTLTDVYDEDAGKESHEWSVRIDNNLRRVQAAGNGVRGDREYVYAGYRSATMTLSRDYFNTEFIDLYQATGPTGTFGTFGVHCQSDEYVTGATPYSLGITFSAGCVVGDPNQYDGGPDILTENITIEAGFNGTDDPVTAVLVNGSENAAASPYIL